MKIWTLSTISRHRFTMFSHEDLDIDYTQWTQVYHVQSWRSGHWLHSVDTGLPCSVMKIWTLSTISGHRFTMFSHEDLDIDYTQWTQVYHVQSWRSGHCVQSVDTCLPCSVMKIWTLITLSRHRFTMFSHEDLDIEYNQWTLVYHVQSWRSGHWIQSV